MRRRRSRSGGMGCLVTAALASVVLIPLLLSVWVWYEWTVRAPKVRLSGRRLAEAMGLAALNHAEKPMGIWYGGVWKGRTIALRPGHRIDRAGSEGFDVSEYVRIVLPVRRVTGKEEPKAAMQAFRDKGYPTGLHWPVHRFQPGKRNLRLLNRSEAAQWIEPAILPLATDLLIHDFPAPLAPIEEFHKVIEDLASVARAIESN